MKKRCRYLLKVVILFPIPMSQIVGPLGRSIFNFLRNRSTLFCFSDLTCLTVPLEPGNFCTTSHPVRGSRYYQPTLTNQAIETQCLRATRSPREGSMPLSHEAPVLDPSLSLSHITRRRATHILRAAQILEPCVLFTGLKIVAIFAQTQRKSPCLPPKGLTFQAYVFLLRITFFITLKVLSFSSEFKNKVNTQMTGYNLEEGRGEIPPT